MAKVSVIVPVYNVAEFLPRCLDSLINQTLQDIEIICINDGSTDNSSEILRQYAIKDSRIKLIDKNNSGVADARNIGLAFANGEYIGFVDSDDWVDSNWYEKLYSVAKNTNADIVRGPTVKNFSDGKSEEMPFNKILNDCIDNNRDLGMNEHFVVIWNSIYRRKILADNHINFISGLFHEDIPFQVKASYYARKIVPANGTVYHYRQNRAGQLSTMNLRFINGIPLVNHHVLDFINMSECINTTDYMGVLSQCIWRADNRFIYAIKELPNFSPEMQKRYFDIWHFDIIRCRNLKLLKKKHHWLRYVVSGNMKKYIRVRLKQDFWHKLARFLKKAKIWGLIPRFG